ncbi:DNA helicase RecQ [uncultured Thiocystis sp.]|jgi:ATP-dependent DNA helicase RecQ|uniref:DNA helicase RecQ n=1 Tax=uncultured Thiocystis sp. TaxID=1202134 RepID=UPI0025FAC257|nr:DNA helicase RecQ [uncultured Thiocystis sp.]
MTDARMDQLDETPLRLLNRVFGFDRFRGAQAEIIDLVIGGGDALVLMPTGGGKSLCYQIPALLRPGTGIVVSPLIALMQDQVDALTQLGVRAAFLNSSLTPDKARAVEQALLSGRLDLLYVAPERLLTERFEDLLDRIPVALFAIDEAHCVSQWGHDFRPEYIQLDRLHTRWPQVPRIALTATADTPTRNEIVTRLSLGRARQFVSSFDRPNIRYRIVEKANPRQQLLAFLRREHPEDAGIVYCLSRRRVDETATFLQGQGFPALPYHAGLPADTRRAHQARFLREEGVVMVATIAFGMGIDKPDVRFVAHLDLPKSLEAYYQETGRAGRDGQPADAWMTYGLGDVVMLRRIIEDSEAEEHFKRIELHKLDGMLGYCETTECRRQVMLHYFGETLPKPCGNCDTCQEPVETWDGTLAAQMALSCIYRTGQRFGSAYLVDVLLGKSLERIRRFGHDRVSTFGIGKEVDGKPVSADQWRSVYRQLVAAGLVAVDMEGHGALKLTEQSRPLLRGERAIRLRRDPERKSGASSRAPVSAAPTDPEAAVLWQALREQRRQLALAQNVPAYVIFADATLREILTYRPRTRDELSQITGVGQAKLERFGAEFLRVLSEHAARHGRPSGLPPLPLRSVARAAPSAGRIWESGDLGDTLVVTLELFRKGMDPEAIALHRNLKSTTIYTHLSRCIEEGELTVEDVVTLDAETRRRIEFAFDQLPEGAMMGLKPVFDAFEGRYDYGLLRCVRAGMGRPSED